MNKNHLGTRIERIRELKNMRQTELAEKLGISQQAVSKMEKSKKISPKRLAEVAEILAVTAEGIEYFNEDIAINSTLHSKSYKYDGKDYPDKKVLAIYEHLLYAEREQVAALEERVRQLEMQLQIK